MNQQAHGFVYVQTNEANINEVIVYRREDDGRLERLGSYLTGGKGSGKPHLPSQSSVVLAGDRLFVTNRGGELVPVSGAIQNTRSEVCWAVVSKDARTAFVTNFGDGTISTYAIGADGSIELREAVAATTVEGQPGIRDEAISSDGRYLYALHADAREVFAWEVAADGTLTALGSANGLPATAAGLAAS